MRAEGRFLIFRTRAVAGWNLPARGGSCPASGALRHGATMHIHLRGGHSFARQEGAGDSGAGALSEAQISPYCAGDDEPLPRPITSNTKSGRSVVMLSTPIVASRSASAGLFTVQACNSIPAARTA